MTIINTRIRVRATHFALDPKKKKKLKQQDPFLTSSASPKRRHSWLRLRKLNRIKLRRNKLSNRTRYQSWTTRRRRRSNCFSKITMARELTKRLERFRSEMEGVWVRFCKFQGKAFYFVSFPFLSFPSSSYMQWTNACFLLWISETYWKSEHQTELQNSQKWLEWVMIVWHDMIEKPRYLSLTLRNFYNYWSMENFSSPKGKSKECFLLGEKIKLHLLKKKEKIKLLKAFTIVNLKSMSILITGSLICLVLNKRNLLHITCESDYNLDN